MTHVANLPTPAPRRTLTAARTPLPRRDLRSVFEALYKALARREYVHPDPLEFVYRYQDSADREIVGLIAAALAYGRVTQILERAEQVFGALGPSPRKLLLQSPDRDLRTRFAAFKHRWTTGAELAVLLIGIRRVLLEHGSLEACFLRYHDSASGHTVSGLAGLVKELAGSVERNSLMPDPAKGSACKRLHLYLRWMVRSDAVDPGCWTRVSPADLIVPLDTHMHRLGRSLRFTRRKQANLAAALDLTRVFRAMNAADPVKYDFVLTRFGIRNELDMRRLLEWCRGGPLPDKAEDVRDLIGCARPPL